MDEFTPYKAVLKEYYLQWADKADFTIQKNLKLKFAHSIRVLHNILDLASALNLDPSTRFLAGLTALFHDIARFKQFALYKTFDDRKSFDHAEESVKILKENKILEQIALDDQERIFVAILYHNKKLLPKFRDPVTELLAKLIRDADKLDVLYIIGKELADTEDPAISLGYSGNSTVNPEIIKLIKQHQLVDYALVRSTVDFKLVVSAWVFDINFPHSLMIITERKLLEPIFHSLPNYHEINTARNAIESFLQSKLKTFS